MTVGMSLSLSTGAEQCHLVPLGPFPISPWLWFCSATMQTCRSGRVKLERKEASCTSGFHFTEQVLSLLCNASQMFLSDPQSCCLFSAVASLLMLSPGVVLELKGVCIAQGTGYNAWLGTVGIWSNNPWRHWMTWIVSVWWLHQM